MPRPIFPSQYLLFHPLEMPYIGAIGRGGSPSGVRVGLRSLLRASAGPTHDLARNSCLWFFGGIISYPREP